MAVGRSTLINGQARPKAFWRSYLVARPNRLPSITPCATFCILWLKLPSPDHYSAQIYTRYMAQTAQHRYKTSFADARWSPPRILNTTRDTWHLLHPHHQLVCKNSDLPTHKPKPLSHLQNRSAHIASASHRRFTCPHHFWSAPHDMTGVRQDTDTTVGSFHLCHTTHVSTPLSFLGPDVPKLLSF